MGKIESEKDLITGYTDKFSVHQGEEITFFISAPTENYQAEVRRMISADSRSGAPGEKHEHIESDIQGTYSGVLQKSSIGSYIEAHDIFTGKTKLPIIINFAFLATKLDTSGDQYLISFNRKDGETGLRISNQMLKLVINGKIYTKLDLTLKRNTWYRTLLYIKEEKVFIEIHLDSKSSYKSPTVRGEAYVNKGELNSHILKGMTTIGAKKIGDKAEAHFNGKIGELSIGIGEMTQEEVSMLLKGINAIETIGTRIVCSWSFGKNISSFEIENDVTGGAKAKLINMPVRAVTGPKWKGEYTHPNLDLEGYNAIYFHEDMVIGGDWKPSLKLKVPETWRSGIYTLRISDEVHEDWIPFYVRPAQNSKRSKVLFLAPTNTYLAYGNERNSLEDIGDALSSLKSEAVVPEEMDKYIGNHPELGLSLYDTHSDGSGVVYASRLRPILNMRPFHRNWLNESYRHFAADLYLIDWLEHFNIDYDVATDEDLHFEGVSLLANYSVVITGSHPEYVSGRMMDALKEYVDSGGNMMYLGGNGFYWTTSYHPECPHLIEVRRGHDGARNFSSAPGEFTHSFTGETGGIWRNRGRSPHRLTGIATGAIGWGKASPYKRNKNSYDPKYSWVFEGVDEEYIGTEGLMLGGAAGDEMDHTDYLHGTPPETVVLASSVDHSEHYQPTIDYYTNMYPNVGGSKNPLVRADMTLLPTTQGGAVFSVGSICWIGCLPINEYNNPVSKVTMNVLKRFTDSNTNI